MTLYSSDSAEVAVMAVVAVAAVVVVAVAGSFNKLSDFRNLWRQTVALRLSSL